AGMQPEEVPESNSEEDSELIGRATGDFDVAARSLLGSVASPCRLLAAQAREFDGFLRSVVARRADVAPCLAALLFGPGDSEGLAPVQRFFLLSRAGQELQVAAKSLDAEPSDKELHEEESEHPCVQRGDAWVRAIHSGSELNVCNLRVDAAAGCDAALPEQLLSLLTVLADVLARFLCTSSGGQEGDQRDEA
ncbi:unnamed protein product, partial [Polarella glacialis]